MPDRRKWGVWSGLACTTVIIGVLAWVLNFTGMEYEGMHPVLLTLVVNPFGVVFGIIAMIRKERKALLWTVLHLFLSVSIFPMWFIGTLLFGP
ncbi:hypothetical protein [Staphylospora marina]|uniref:hypothetical protein n=1 Tax=Staphylospora marina TaxID=2490858 RepID=UPI000F5C1642|nr:hypothetical protein [Staphylospora marina]